MEQEHYYAIETKDNELKHYGVKGMHWGIRRYQPYTSNPRKDGKGGKFIGNKPKAKIVKDKKGFIGIAGGAVVGAVAGGAMAAYKLHKQKKQKNEKEKLNSFEKKQKQKAKEGMDYLKITRPPDAVRDIANAGAKVHEALKEFDDWYAEAKTKGKMEKGVYHVVIDEKEFDKRQNKINNARDNYKKTLQKWDFDMDGETEYDRPFLEECYNNRSINNSKSGLTKDSKSGLFNPNRSGINSLGWNESRAKEEARSAYSGTNKKKKNYRVRSK